MVASDIFVTLEDTEENMTTGKNIVTAAQMVVRALLQIVAQAPSPTRTLPSPKHGQSSRCRCDF
jgi:hypothetical protein